MVKLSGLESRGENGYLYTLERMEQRRHFLQHGSTLVRQRGWCDAALPLNNLNSWWSFAALHGEYLTDTQFPGWGHLPSPPATPTTPLPPQNIQDQYWNQCQHQSWYFLPWHRGYLIALEAQIRAAVMAAGGPSTWALPYWDYFAANESNIPPAFTVPTLPDGSPNPLAVKARYGPLGS